VLGAARHCDGTVQHLQSSWSAAYIHISDDGSDFPGQSMRHHGIP